MTVPLTEVQIHFLHDLLNHRLRFGRPVRDTYLDRRRALAWFSPGAVFGYIRWRNGPYGTEQWRLYVLRAGTPGGDLNQVAGVEPGAEILLRLDGAARVKPALEIVDAIEGLGLDPVDVAPDYWRHVHNRLFGGGRPHVYDLDQHRAWLRRRELAL